MVDTTHANTMYCCDFKALKPPVVHLCLTNLPQEQDCSTTTTITNTTTPICLIEHGVDYKGYDLNDNITDDSQPDWQSCQSFCSANYPSAQYFATHLYKNTCWCKTSNTNQKVVTGVVSGEVTCGSQSEYQNTG